MKKFIPIIIVICLIALWPFFKRGYFESHDGEWMVIRFTAFHQSLIAGQIPVRFTDRLNNNYGYPVLNFLYPLPFYMAEIPKIIGFGFVDSIKIIFVLSTITSAAAMYWAIKQLFWEWESFAAALIYVYFPYRFADLYVRGSLGEIVAFTFLPLIFGSIIQITKGNKLFIPLLAFFIAALILSHNVMAALFIPLFFIIALLQVKKERISFITSFILGILMSAFFALPAIYDLRFVRLSQIKVSNTEDHLASAVQLIKPVWGYGPNPQDSFPVQIGIVPLVVLLAALVIYIKEKRKTPIIGLLITVSAASAFLMTKMSSYIWEWVPFLDVIQFPWRLLAVIMFSVSILCAYVINSTEFKKVAASLVVIAAIAATILYTKPRSFVDRGDGFYSTNEDTTTVRDEYLPLWVIEKPDKRAEQRVDLKDGQIISQNFKAGNYQLVAKADRKTTVATNTIYFPGWQVKVDGKQVPVSYDNKFGLTNFDLPEGEHKVIINYTRSPVHLLSEIVSLVAILTTGIYFFNLWRKNQNSL